MLEVIPAIIPEDFTHLTRKMERVAKFVPRVQVDVIDGIYAKPASWPYNNKDRALWEAIRTQQQGMPLWETLSFEIDLMVEKPEEKIDDWINAGAEIVIVHIESTEHYAPIWEKAAQRGVRVALALKPSTDMERLERAMSDVGRDNIAFIQCMGSDDIGRHGVMLDEKVFAVLDEIKKRWSDATLGIDIGVNEKTAPRLVKAGVTHLVSGSAILESEDVKETLEYFKSLEA